MVYTLPAIHFDLIEYNAMTGDLMGAVVFAYWAGFAPQDGAHLLYDLLEHTFRAQRGKGKAISGIP